MFIVKHKDTSNSPLKTTTLRIWGSYHFDLILFIMLQLKHIVRSQIKSQKRPHIRIDFLRKIQQDLMSDPISELRSSLISKLSCECDCWTAGLHSPHSCLKCTWKRENASVKISFPPFAIKISRQIPYRISNQVSYLSWSVNLTPYGESQMHLRERMLV